MLETVKWLRASRGVPARQVLAQAEALRKGLGRLADQGASEDQLYKVKAAARDAIAADLAEANVKEKERLAGELVKLGEVWRKDYDKHLAEHDRAIANYERKVRAMSEKERGEEVLRVMGGTPGDDPALYDVLSISLQGTEDHSPLREWMVKEHAAEPWRHGETGRGIAKDMESIRHDSVLLKVEDGRRFAMSVDEVLEHLGADDEQV